MPRAARIRPIATLPAVGRRPASTNACTAPAVPAEAQTSPAKKPADGADNREAVPDDPAAGQRPERPRAAKPRRIAEQARPMHTPPGTAADPWCNGSARPDRAPSPGSANHPADRRHPAQRTRTARAGDGRTAPAPHPTATRRSPRRSDCRRTASATTYARSSRSSTCPAARMPCTARALARASRVDVP